MTSSTPSRERRASIAELCEHAAHLLPQQAPLHAFVHHNTLHLFEHLPFEEAVVEGARQFRTEPFQTEAAFARHLAGGRIKPEDIDAVLAEDSALDAAYGRPILPGGPTRRQLRALRLRHLFEVPRGPALLWLLGEADVRTRLSPLVEEGRREALLKRASSDGAREGREGSASKGRQARLLERLWAHLEQAREPHREATSWARRRDQVLASTGFDTDELVHPLLIRLTAAFLDQGVAYWSMPEREAGFLSAFRRLYGRPFGPPDRFLRGLSEELRRQEAEGWDAERTIRWALEALRVPEGDWDKAIEATLLSLRGWAGMMYQFEQRPDRAPVEARSARLIDYLAVELTLDVFATQSALGDHGDEVAFDPQSGEGTPAAQAAAKRPRDLTPSSHLELVYEAFVLAQLAPIDLDLFADERHARAFLDEVRAFDEMARRRALHLAYERRHRVVVLDGLLAHARVSVTPPPKPELQVVLCMDDREESLRRHIEESCPTAETFGYAGFFGVPMSYKGLDDVRPRPLCPVVVRPRHLVVERAVDPSGQEAYRTARRKQGALTHSLSVGSKTLTRGSLMTATLGFTSIMPLVGRALFPRLWERWSRPLREGLVERPKTRLQIERAEGDDAVNEDGLLLGFLVSEMVNLVFTVLTNSALSPGRSPIVLIAGHGSSSLNNPHEAAYDCGATGGGRGGPNARAFAAMANHPAVREGLRARGIDIPEGTWFLGALHDTADDSMTYYDDDLVPEALLPALERAKRVMAEACARNAHERCRRFESAPKGASPRKTLAHAEGRARDLAQPRPECGHATNAVCIVGRRARTRGLFLDRRSFLVSYDPTTDATNEVLAGLLMAVGPVGAGINLEYYFSYVDSAGYGCGSKLPHNIVGLFGVMDGHASDLRTGLPWQMVEIHEPVRLLLIAEIEPERLERLLSERPALDRLVRNGWIQVVAWSPEADRMHVFQRGAFRPYTPETTAIPIVDRSAEFYGDSIDHLGPAHIRSSFREALA